MNTKYYLEFLKNEIHSTVFASVDKNSIPFTSAIDIMMVDDNSLYFLTAKGKSFYERISLNPNVSVTGIKGEDTMTSKSITIHGKVHELGSFLLPKLFELNPYMETIYPNAKSRSSLTTFQMYEGYGEFFDLSQKPIFRESFTLGNIEVKEKGYFVTDKCIGCGICGSVCPQKCIDIFDRKAYIKQKNCLHCGKCLEVCPKKAIIHN